jgi:hypothetical protein
LSFRFSFQIDVRIFPVSCLCHLLHRFPIPWPDIPNDAGIRYTLRSPFLGLQASNFLLASVIFKCCPNRPVLEILNGLKKCYKHRNDLIPAHSKCYVLYQKTKWQSFRIGAENGGIKVVVEGIVFLRCTASGLNHGVDEIILMKLQKRQAAGTRLAYNSGCI